MCDEIPEFGIWNLDNALTYFGYENRDNGEFHDAVKDCKATALVYMKLVKMPKRKPARLGWMKEVKE